jgi:type II secretory pathway component PulK
MRIQLSSSARGGIALIIVMISIFVLSMLAGGLAISMKVETRLAQHANNETELQWLGRSGVEYARWMLALQLACPNEPYDALNQTWAGGSGGPCSTNGPLADIQKEVHLGRGSFTWKITDTESKANINTAGEGMLQRALTLMGANASETTPTVNAILDWIDRDDSERVEGAESDVYKNEKPPYEAKNGPIDDITELLMIRGIKDRPELYYGSAALSNAPVLPSQHPFAMPNEQPLLTVGLADLFTPISGGKININTASAEVLQLIPGVDNNVAQAIIAARSGDNDGSGTTGPFLNISPQYLWTRVPGLNLDIARGIGQFCDVRSRTFQIEINAQVGLSKRTYYAIVVRNNPRDIQVVNFYWKI